MKTFEEKYITFNKRVEEKIKAMREQKQYIFKNIYVFDEIFQDKKDEIKFGYFNINGFMRSNHAEYLDFDLNLLHLDFLVIAETWLNKETTNEDVRKKLSNWRVLKRVDASDNMKHMGLLLITSSRTENGILYDTHHIEGYKQNTKKLLYQGLVVEIKHLYLRLVFLYIRETPNSEEVKNLNQYLKNVDCIIGDLNLNPKISEQKMKIMTLCGDTKYMALEEETTINGTHLDHVLIEQELENRSFATDSLYSFRYFIFVCFLSLSNKFALSVSVLLWLVVAEL